MPPAESYDNTLTANIGTGDTELSFVNAFTVDVEDYYHVSAFADRIPTSHWDHFESRVVQNTQRLLELLHKFEVRGTFFVLGWVADRHPQLISEIHEAGHEIGCHSYWHRLVYDLTPDEFRRDLRRACDSIEQIVGAKINIYRAPSFSITGRSLWAMEILAEEGIEIDSSVYPVRHDRYGIPGAELQPHQNETQSGSVWEFPASVNSLGKFRIPVGGGGYFRLYPLAVTRRWLNRINRTGRPFMFYVHPWEIDPDQPALQGSLYSKFRHRINLAGTWNKLERILRCFRFGTMSDALSHYRDSCKSPSLQDVLVIE